VREELDPKLNWETQFFEGLRIASVLTNLTKIGHHLVLGEETFELLLRGEICGILGGFEVLHECSSVLDAL
jgi:hypothetical protein